MTVVPQKPADLYASKPEWAIYWALNRLGLRDGQDFTFQSAQLGGRASYGGAVLDFEIPSRGIAINVQSVHWHYETSADRQADMVIKERMASFGVQLVYIDEDDALRDAMYYTSQALKGIDHSNIGV